MKGSQESFDVRKPYEKKHSGKEYKRQCEVAAEQSHHQWRGEERLAGTKQGPIPRERSLADDWRVGASQHFGAPDDREVSGDDGVTVP